MTDVVTPPAGANPAVIPEAAGQCRCGLRIQQRGSLLVTDVSYSFAHESPSGHRSQR